MNQNDGQNKLGNNNPNQGVPNNQNGSSFNVPKHDAPHAAHSNGSFQDSLNRKPVRMDNDSPSSTLNRMKDAAKNKMIDAIPGGRQIKNAKDMDSADIMTSVKRVTNYKLTIDDYLDLMLMWYRDVLMFKSTNDTNLLIFNDQMTLIKSQAQTMSYEGLQDIINSIDRVKVRLQANVNFDLVIELLIMAIKENS